jgi:hypothetical protein
VSAHSYCWVKKLMRKTEIIVSYFMGDLYLSNTFHITIEPEVREMEFAMQEFLINNVK